MNVITYLATLLRTGAFFRVLNKVFILTGEKENQCNSVIVQA